MNAPIIIEMEDELIHVLPSKVFCPIAQYPDCPCRHDLILIEQFLLPAIERGITQEQAKRIWRGELPADFDIGELAQCPFCPEDDMHTIELDFFGKQC